tara:strand:- start:903 stop:1850 length:948 start_codon:yes stop_codon:yes gene_type:complete
MKILVLGNSNIFQRRILPALNKLAEITSIDLASNTNSGASLNSIKIRKIYKSYDKALNDSDAKVIYISLINSLHYEFGRKALLLGKHLIIDKPLTNNNTHTLSLLNLAKEKSLCIAEATVYEFHKQVELLKAMSSKEGTNPKAIAVNFSFPPFEIDNYRFNKKLGGGAIEDLGPYALSPGRLFFNSTPIKITALSNDVIDDLCTGFSFLAEYPNKRSLFGHCGFHTPYINKLSLISSQQILEIERIFTTPPNMQNKIIQKTKTGVKEINIDECDSFEVFLINVLQSIKSNCFHSFYNQIEMDNFAINLLRKSISK